MQDTSKDSNELLKISNMSVQSNGVLLLEGVDITMSKGDLIAITGPSGCGKTTLLRSIAGLISPVSGALKLNGNSETKIDPAYRSKVIYVNQRPTLLDLSIEDNLKRPFTYDEIDLKFDLKRAKKLLDHFDIGSNRLLQSAKSLSIGQQQRVCLIRAMLLDPLLLLLDEPTSALDMESIEIIEDNLKALAKNQGIGIMIVTHDPQQVKRICNKTVDLTANIKGAKNA